MVDELTTLAGTTGQPLAEEQLHGLIAQIDLDVANLLRDGKLAAAPLQAGGTGGISVDRAENLKMLLAARAHYAELLAGLPGWTVTHG